MLQQTQTATDDNEYFEYDVVEDAAFWGWPWGMATIEDLLDSV